MNEYKREYYKRNREKILEYQKEYNRENIQQINLYQKKYQKQKIMCQYCKKFFTKSYLDYHIFKSH